MNATSPLKYYLDFLRFSLNEEAEVPVAARHINWHSLLLFAKDQSLVGIYWMGVRRLGSQKENKPTDDDVMEWMAVCGQLARRNEHVTERSAWVARNFQKEGFLSCLLKGQGNGLLYPDPSLRTPGDIDIWVTPSPTPALPRREGESPTPNPSPVGKGTCQGGVSTVIAYCRQFVPDAKACYHHIDFLNAGDVPVEVHYRPSWLNNPFHNSRLQTYFQKHAAEQFANEQPQGFAVPTWDFNVVFQLCHIANHLLHEGIGLRQIVDYYYLLRSNTQRKDINDYEQVFRHVGLLPFARPLMWVLAQVLGLDERFLVARQDERRGRLLLNELLASGDLGKHDDRVLSGTYSSPLKANLQRVVRDLRMVRYYPSECFWEPIFRIRHFFWRWQHRPRRQ